MGKVLVVTPKGPDKLGRIRRLNNLLEGQGFDVDFLIFNKLSSDTNLGSLTRLRTKWLLSFLYYFRGISFGPLSFLWHKIMYKSFYLEYLSLEASYDVIFIEHVDFIYFPSSKLANRIKYIFDVKDYFPRNFEDSFLWVLLIGRFYKYLFKHFLHTYDVVISVSNELKDVLLKEFARDSIVVPNSLSFVSQNGFKRREELTFVYSGSSTPERGVEDLIRIFIELSHLKLFLYLVGDSRDLLRLRKMASGADNIIFKEVVALDMIVTEISQYCVFIINFQKGNLNNYYSLPNKLFEAIQARLFVLSTPCESIARLVNKYNIGWVARSFARDEMKYLVNSLTMLDLNSVQSSIDFAASELTYESHTKELISMLNE